MTDQSQQSSFLNCKIVEEYLKIIVAVINPLQIKESDIQFFFYFIVSDASEPAFSLLSIIFG
jgi:hypothetical protein